MSEVEAFAVEAELELRGGIDPAAVGASVTSALCGHWEHKGPCYWPHNNEIRATAESAVFRTVFVAAEGEERTVRSRIAVALTDSPDWKLVSIGRRALAGDELELAGSLLRGPRAPGPLA